MNHIQATFQKAKVVALSECSNNELSSFLSTRNDEFTSVAYEGASMGVAMNSLRNTGTITEWKPFFDYHRKSHSSQILIGLGWALCELNIDVNSTLERFNPQYKWRILDGYGYYNGLLKRRDAIRKQLVPNVINSEWLSGFNQGLGRSLWYIVKGDVSRLLRLMELFPPERYSYLWRAIGIAVTYVGGIDDEVLLKLTDGAKTNIASLKCGVAMALYSREKANSLSEDSFAVGRFFLSDVKSAIGEIDIIENQTYSSVPMYNAALKVLEGQL